MKKCCSWILMITMLLLIALPCIPVVHAEEIPKGQFYGMSENRYRPGDVLIWNYTPPSDGEYLLENQNGCLNISLEGQSPLSSSDGINLNYYRVYRLSGGVPYQIKASLYDGYGETTAAFNIQKKEPLQSLTLDTNTMSIGKGETYSLTADFYPGYYAASAIRWTSANDKIVSVEGSEGRQGSVRGTGFGTATVTASLGGMQASCTVEVVKPQGEWDSYPLWTGTQNSVSGTKQFRYEPTQTGWYVTHLSTGSGYVELRQTTWATELPQRHAHLYNGQYELYYLQSGETYVVTVVGSGTVTAVLQPAQSAKKITLFGPNNTDGTKIVGAVGGQMSLYAQTDPLYAYALAEEGFVFTSSDPSVARLEGSGNPGEPSREVVLVAPGKATITVSAGNVKAQCQVTVAGEYVFKTGQTTTLKLSGEAYGVTGIFTPEKSGNYRFTMTGTGGTASIEGTDIGTYVNGSGTMSGWLEGGKTYLVKLSFGGSDHTVKVEYLGGEEPPKGDGDPDRNAAPEATGPVTVVQVEGQQGQQQQTVSRDQVEQLVETGGTLEVRGGDVVVLLDAKALAAAAALSDRDVALTMTTLGMEALSDAQKAAVDEAAFVKAVEISLHCGDVDIHDLGGGKATVTLPFQPEKGYRGDDYKVFWLSENGELEEMQTKYENGSLQFTTDHFSTFVILRTQKGDTWLVPVLCVAAALLVAGGVVTFILLRKKKHA